jgi:hypothetical protein
LTPRSSGDIGIPLFLGQDGAILAGGGGETGAVSDLGGRARVLGSDPATAALLAAREPVKHPIAASATAEGGIKALA